MKTREDEIVRGRESERARERESERARERESEDETNLVKIILALQAWSR